MNRIDRTIVALNRRHVAEKRRISGALRRLPRRGHVPVSRALDVAQEIILAGDRTLRKRESDTRTDRARRILIGAKIPRDVADLYKTQAQEEQISIYRWAVNAFGVYYALHWGRWGSMKTIAQDEVIAILKNLESATVDREKSKAIEIAIECVENWYAVMGELLN